MELHSDDLKLFVALVDSGGFGAAAERLGQTTSAVSRALARLEGKLGVTLLIRTTRRMELTEEGALLLSRARDVLAALDDAAESVRQQRQQPSGHLRIDAAVPVVLHVIVPHVAEFRVRYPNITLELSSNDQVADLLEHRTDVAIRVGELADSTLHARRLRAGPMAVLASPDYLARHGRPNTPAELAAHQTIGFLQYDGNNWPLRHGDEEWFRIDPAIYAASGETIRALAMAGQGIACLSDFMTKKDIEAGKLIPILEDWYTGYQRPIHAVYYRREQPSRRVGVFLDFIQEKLEQS